MIEIIPLEEPHVGWIANNIQRTQLNYHEYSFISDSQLKEYFKNRTIVSLSNKDYYSYIARQDKKLLGLIKCTKDNFDSENFGFPCYRITDLLVFSVNTRDIFITIKMLISALEEKLATISKPFHIDISLNNNTHDVGQVFNNIIANNYYYIHTLITFSSLKNRYESQGYYSNENLTIRVVNNQDSLQVSNLAQRSFKYSRFHMDPFLDNTKAGLLLKKSAENSILNGFVDVMFVAEIEGKIVGYYSGKKRIISEFNKTIGEAVISAVDSDYRGHGIFSKMDSHLLNWFADNTDFAEMGTYLINYPVHKTWISKKLGLIRGTHQFSKYIK